MKLLLVIDVADDVAKNYKALTVNYDLRGDYGEWYESIKYVEDCPLIPLPQKVEMDMNEYYEGLADGWNACIDEIMGEPE